MSEINPITRLYGDIKRILDCMIIKYSVQADKYETMTTRAEADKYLDALAGKDDFYTYDDYTLEDYALAGITDEEEATRYIEDWTYVPDIIQGKVLDVRRARMIRDYVEGNNYYRMLNGLPDIEDEDPIYVSEEYCNLCGIPRDMPIHEISDKMGKYYINVLEGYGYLDQLMEEYPDKKYIEYLATKRISLSISRNAKNFSILYISGENIMESTYREFVNMYERSRLYYVNTCYVTQLRDVVENYDNFIALCIFIMTIQQVSMRSIKNAVDREFYDEYMVQLLYETYGLTYYSRIDQETQKAIVQNLNILVQNKATDKVLLDIATILGFNDITIYQYYLMKEHRKDASGRPIFKKKKQVSPITGEVEEVYDTDAMYSVYFQKVPLMTENVQEALSNPLNKVEYNEVTYYDPFWWEDDDLHHEIYDSQYNYFATKYISVTTPFKLTEMLFQSIILLRMIIEKSKEVGDVFVELPRVLEKTLSITDAVILFLALMAKKYGIKGNILSTPSKIIGALELGDREVEPTYTGKEVLAFDFDAFNVDNLEETIGDMKKYLQKKRYRIVDGHDVDLNPDGTQNKSSPTHKVSYTISTEYLDEFYKYISTLTIQGARPAEKVKALNALFENIELLYNFLSYHMSLTTDPEEYYALRKFYDAAFYAQETNKMFKVIDADGNEHYPDTFAEYFKYKDGDIYEFIQSLEDDDIYVVIDHIIYKLDRLIGNVGYLYILNDGFSPLMELLQIMIKFFKSYRLDFVELSSLMVVDWDIENMVRFFGKVEHISKRNQVEDQFSAEFGDLIHKFISRGRIEDRIAVTEYIASKSRAHVNDGFYFSDMQKYFNARKVDAVSDMIAFMDIPRIKTVIYLEDSLNLGDELNNNESVKEDIEDVSKESER